MKQTKQDRIVTLLNKYATEKDELQQRYGASRVGFEDMLAELADIQDRYAKAIDRAARK